MARKILVIGGLSAGPSAATKARRTDEGAEIILFEKGEHISFATCGLPYYVSNEINSQKDLIIWSPEKFSNTFNIDTRPGHEVKRIHRHEKEVVVEDLKTGKGYREKYDRLILATGTEPILPENINVGAENLFLLRTISDSENIRNFIEQRRPSKAVIIGSGFIGLETAEALLKLGLEVTMIEVLPQVFPMFDEDMALILAERLKRAGIELSLGAKIKGTTGAEWIKELVLEDGNKVSADLVVIATGVRPNIKLAAECNLEIGERGGIKVDERMRTSDPDIFACGDAVEKVHLVTGEKVLVPLAGPAQREGRVAGANACGGNLTFPGVLGTSVVRFMDTVIARTGINEKEARRSGFDYFVSYTHSPSHATYYPGAERMTIKIIVERSSGKLLGAQIIGGQGVDKRIDIFATAIFSKLRVEDLENLDLGYTPPFSSAKDPTVMASMVAANVLRNDLELITSEELKSLIDQDEMQIIDVRSRDEFIGGAISKARSIPLDELRDRISELNPEKRTVVYCPVGYRSYLAYRILKHHGFKNLKNLSGGYSSWKVMEKNLALNEVKGWTRADEPPSEKADARG